ncbi:MAG TPA: bifunctional 2-polyprenyl-6-hydroxyphenol methylase/3-demethylubiquinol 3-O-methyltransferase UbiG [Candidatus Hydrogenedentes bacterium]|nr:bifunctional 2-polyprenyl-6-hydroxyphenol methylase/3-demethylubiquinol 3-O-methyltransferase UbiG [Candidatus Hydrogenedentota bacterium]
MTPPYAIDNEMYKYKGHVWWDDNESPATLRFFINPIRFAYFLRILDVHRGINYSLNTVLDVGCGGGFLTEEFAKAGYSVKGVDPAEESLDCARNHALENGLNIDYRAGCGEHLPFPDASFDIVLCCDVLEHVDDIQVVLQEISRVLKDGGLFFYDTVNRTWASYFIVIKILQDWPFTAQHEPRSHVWEMFVAPEELCAAMASAKLIHKEQRGLSARGSMIRNLINLRRRVQGKISFRELGERLKFHESSDLRVSYMGYAVKAASEESDRERAFRKLGQRLGFNKSGDQL